MIHAHSPRVPPAAYNDVSPRVVHQMCAKKEDHEHLMGVIEAGWGNFDAFNAIVRNALKLRGRTSCAKHAWKAVEQPPPKPPKPPASIPNKLKRAGRSIHLFGKREHDTPAASRSPGQSVSTGHLPHVRLWPADLVQKVKSLALLPLGGSRVTYNGSRRSEVSPTVDSTGAPHECPPPAADRRIRAAPTAAGTGVDASGNVRV